MRFAQGAARIVFAALLSGCSTLVTPATIEASDAGLDEKRIAVDSWRDAVELANEFLASESRHSLPPAHYELTDDRGMVFVTDDERRPIHVWNSFGGTLVVWFGFRAQERAEGFVVGPRAPDEVDEIDNSMFRLPPDDGETTGAWHDADSIAELILHETAHAYHGEGTVGYWSTLLYYLEAVFLFRAANHSAERIPRAISEEFVYSRLIAEAREGTDPEMARAYVDALERHLAEEHANCTHLDL